jgi:hypothetical protein
MTRSDEAERGVAASGRFDPGAAHGMELARNLRLWEDLLQAL